MIPATIDKEGIQYDATLMRMYVSCLRPGEYTLEIKPSVGISARQRAFYRGYLLPQFAMKVAGGALTANDWHNILAGNFLTHEVEIDGLIYSMPKSTSQGGGVSKAEFSEYIDQCIARAAEHGLIITKRL